MSAGGDCVVCFVLGGFTKERRKAYQRASQSLMDHCGHRGCVLAHSVAVSACTERRCMQNRIAHITPHSELACQHCWRVTGDMCMRVAHMLFTIVRASSLLDVAAPQQPALAPVQRRECCD
jgi:hypothetical protein